MSCRCLQALSIIQFSKIIFFVLYFFCKFCFKKTHRFCSGTVYSINTPESSFWIKPFLTPKNLQKQKSIFTFFYLKISRILILLDVKVVSSECSALLLLSPLLQLIGLKPLSAWDGSLGWSLHVSSKTWFRNGEQGNYLGLHPHHPSRLKLDGLTVGSSVQNIQFQQKQVFRCK